MNDEQGRTWKEAVVAYYKILSQHLSGGTEVTVSSDRDVKQEPPG
jgi:hypothetical protein